VDPPPGPISDVLDRIDQIVSPAVTVNVAEMALPQVAAVALAMMQGSARSLPTEVRDRFTATATGRIRAALSLASAEGELDPAVDPQDALALLVGPILQRTCFQAGTVSDELIDRLMDSIGTWHSGQRAAQAGEPE
jgi:hypothetical protein